MVFKKGQTSWMKGKHHTPESNKKNRESHKGKPAWNKGKKLGFIPKGAFKKGNVPLNKGKHIQTNTGKTHFKKGQIPWNIGIPMSEEIRKKLSERNKGNKYHLGKHLSEESKKLISEATKKAMANPKVKKRLSESHKGFHSSSKTEFKKGFTPWIKGRKHSEKSKRKMSLANKGKLPWDTGKHHSEETKRKIGLAGKGKPAWNKGKHPSEETIKKQMETLRKRWLSNPELRKRQSESSRATLLRLYESRKFPRQENTKPERQIKEELLKRGYKEGIDFIHQYKFMNKFMCDFCFPQKKVIVEAYGDFWHANPQKYPAGSPLHSHQIKDIRQDKSKEAYITKVDNHTWTYLVFWESDIKKDVVKCVDRIEEVLAEKKKI